MAVYYHSLDLESGLVVEYCFLSFITLQLSHYRRKKQAANDFFIIHLSVSISLSLSVSVSVSLSLSLSTKYRKCQQ